uniref:Pancreatic trypsin inhibitor n=1 Tax=Rhipicephalus zambeziensis TaxID=60191 RepID=A0A224YB26_9ACAR
MKLCVLLLSAFFFGSCAATSYSPEDNRCLTSSLVMPAGYCWKSYWQYNPFYKRCVSTCNPLAPFSTKRECDYSCRTIAVCKAPRPISKCEFGSYPVYYYDPRTRNCVRTSQCTYYGNNFPTLRDCQETCMRQEPSGPNVDPCSMLPSEGYYCKGRFGTFRFLYDNGTRTCNLFWYRGCGGTQNNFPSYYTCLSRCAGNYVQESSQKLLDAKY